MARSIFSSGDRWGESPKSIIFQGCLNIFEAALQIDDFYLTKNPNIDRIYESNWIEYLKCCPDVLKYRDEHGNSLLHHLCSFYIEELLPRKLLVIVLKMSSENILSCKNSDGHTIADVASVYSTLEIILIVLEYTVSYQSLINPLCFSLESFYLHGNKEQVVKKLMFFVNRDKKIIRMRHSKNHLTPFHRWLEINRNGREHMPDKFFYFCELFISLDPECCSDIRRYYHPRCDNSVLDLPKDDRLPLMVLLQRDDFRWVSTRANCNSRTCMYFQLFRSILDAFPNAAHTKCWSTQRGTNLYLEEKILKSPYQYAVDMKMNTVYLRLLLNVRPDIDSVQMKQYNFEARKLSLMLGCWKGLVTATLCPNIFSSVCTVNFVVFKKIVLYL